jgi:predicted amidohydrolase
MSIMTSLVCSTTPCRKASSLQTYIEDARSAGDNDLAGFFEEVQQQDRQRTERAKQLLGRKLS